jgi:hypothetical protein
VGAQSGSIESIFDRGEFDRGGHVFINGHLQQLVRHPVSRFFDALAGLGFDRRSVMTRRGS